MLDRPLRLHPQVAIRPEPFGALAYHYGNRRLLFVKHPDLVDVLEVLDEHGSVAEALTACGVAEQRWKAFEQAIDSLRRSDMLEEAR